ncbi:polyketide synthase [Yoonia sp. GPGPB17]|uniref:beta-ketoacyl [acyl carrier protein] synthase domain-containing protein n=1 Tax=Yoonia sp. GPGPB17 TaxID=3026147 RepID=UPI0030C1C34B
MTDPVSQDEPNTQTDGIAIIGMAVRLPGADTINDFWEMLVEGDVALQTQSRDQLLSRGVRPQDLKDPRYVPVSSIIDQAEGFDTEYFRISKAEARLMDPQHRLALECSVNALEDAAYTPDQVGADVGVFMSVGKNAYFEQNIRPNNSILEDVGIPRALLYNDRTYAATYISYRLGLSGPALHVDSACSGSAAAIHMACQSLRTGECQMALALAERECFCRTVLVIWGEKSA